MIYLGGDFGFGNMKFYGKNGSSLISSLVAKVDHDYISDANRNLGHTHYIEIDGQRYVVGVAAWSIGKARHNQSMDRLLKGTYDAKVSIYAALGQYFNGNRIREGLNMYVGLPALLMTGNNKAATSASVSSWLIGEHSWTFNGKPMSATVESISVRTQATGALGDMIHNLNGQQTKEVEFMDSGIGVISIGMNTVEISGAKRGRPVDTMIRSYENSGVRKLIDAIARLTSQKTGEVDEDLRSGRQEIPENILDDWADDIIGQISEAWIDHLPTIKRILLVGGGAQYIAGAMRQRLGDIVYVPSDPLLCVSRGLYKWSLANGSKG